MYIVVYVDNHVCTHTAAVWVKDNVKEFPPRTASLQCEVNVHTISSAWYVRASGALMRLLLMHCTRVGETCRRNGWLKDCGAAAKANQAIISPQCFVLGNISYVYTMVNKHIVVPYKFAQLT